MQSSTATTTLLAHRQHTNAPGYNHHRDHRSASTRVDACPNVLHLVAQPVQPASKRDFHLDTFFNPVWMSGPHVFSFAKDGRIVRPETYPAEPYPGYRTSASSSLRRDARGASPGGTVASSSPSLTPTPTPTPTPTLTTPLPRTLFSKAPTRMDKPWKNIAITEQDDAEFAAMEVMAQAEAKAKLVGLVYTWPPKPQAAACTECEVLLGPRRSDVLGTGAWAGPRTGVRAGTGTQGSVPALSYGSSGESESDSEMFRVVPGRRAVGRRKEVPPEKSVGFGRVERKAPVPTPTPYVLVGTEEGEGARGRTHVGAPRGVRKVEADSFWNPFVSEVWVEDELTVRLKAILRMPDV